MKKLLTPRFLASFALLLTALIWGFAFVAQSEGGKLMPPIAFNGIRSLIGFLALIPVFLSMDAVQKKKQGLFGEMRERKMLWIGGIVCGIILCLASNLQQWAMLTASSGKAGFLTALYIVMVPIVGIFFHKKSSLQLWFAALLAIFGMYLLCFTADGKGMNASDFALLACSLCFTFHILAIDYFAPKADPVRISAIQFLICGILSLLVSPLLKEHWTFSQVQSAMMPLLYCGLGSSAIGYTLQMVAQKYAHPVAATILMSLESVFSVLGGWLLQNQRLTVRELLGCAIIFIGVLLAQLPIGQEKESSPTSESSTAN